MSKVAVACCERGTGEYHALVLRKEMFAQYRPNIHRRTHQGHVGALTAATLLADLHPVHTPRQRLRQEITRTRGVRLCARCVGIQLKLISFIRNAVAQHAQRCGKLQHRPAQVVAHRILVTHTTRRLCELLMPAPQRVKLPIRSAFAVTNAANGIFNNCFRCVIGAHRAQIATTSAHLIKRAQEMPNAALRESNTKVLCRNIFNLMCFVKNHMVVVREHSASRTRAGTHC